MGQRILVATDGTDGSLGALHTARNLEERGEASVRVVSVVKGLYPAETGLMEEWAVDEMRETGIRKRTREVLNQLQELGREEWPLGVRTGSPSQAVVEEARSVGATLLLMGLGRRRPPDRFLGTGLPARVTGLSPVPVLAVEGERRRLPIKVVVGVDFSSFTPLTISATAFLTGPEARVDLLHVMSLPRGSRTGWLEGYRERASQALEPWRDELSKGTALQVRTHVLAGDPSTALLGFARDRGAELLVVGSHGHSFLERALIGSVPGKLLRAADCAVFVVPGGQPSE